MAKIIKLTEKDINAIREGFEEAIKTVKVSDGKFTFTKSFGSVKREATVFFTIPAWLKMQRLIEKFDKEVAWHGICRRGENEEKDEYIVSDILVYPQEVTGATVTTDQKEYQSWLMALDDDTFNNLRMQGHSHVNMGTTPSTVDTSLYDRILEQLEDDMFYVFMIWNKKGEKTVKIYDLKKNILFDTADVKVKLLEDEYGIDGFIEDAKKAVKDKPAAVPAAKTAAATSSYSGTYRGGYYDDDYSYYDSYGTYRGNYGYSGSYSYRNSASSVENTDDKEDKSSTFAKTKKKRKGKRVVR